MFFVVFMVAEVVVFTTEVTPATRTTETGATFETAETAAPEIPAASAAAEIPAPESAFATAKVQLALVPSDGGRPRRSDGNTNGQQCDCYLPHVGLQSPE
ncbi:Hypothetical protein NTJ_02355 [Nesidiocoris tenuis]|uniref:Secreted protein n=1 Tax=Nesidiocoris tenuis TaxID=355587 RepID=A0ABN7AB73_9HEMI|nr:Hypothetical protein NTJ_02355 [Nesidiocoris tenuis]